MLYMLLLRLFFERFGVKSCDVLVGRFAQACDADEFEELYAEQVNGGAQQENDQGCCQRVSDHEDAGLVREGNKGVLENVLED